MALEPKEAAWLNRLSGGLVPLTFDPIDSGDDDDAVAARKLAELKARFQIARNKEVVEELALKQVMLDDAAEALEAKKDAIRKAFTMTAKVDGKKIKSHDKRGDQTREIETKDIKKDSEVEGDQDAANTMMELIATQRTRLSNAQVSRSVLDEERLAIVVAKEALFTDDEVTKEFYTPLVRDLVVPENLVPPRFSATQKMVSGSNDYYIKECQERGKDIDGGVANFAKGVMSTASQCVGAAFGAHSDIAIITDGTAALLSVGIDGTKKIVDKELSSSDWTGIVGGMAGPIGDIVSGATGMDKLEIQGNSGAYAGTFIADSLSTAINGVDIGIRIIKWRKSGGPFPVAAIITDVSSAVSSGFSIKSDLASGVTALDAGDTSTFIAEAGGIASKTFTALANADAAGLGDALIDGDWKKVKRLMRTYAVDAGIAAAVEISKAIASLEVNQEEFVSGKESSDQQDKVVAEDTEQGDSDEVIDKDKEKIAEKLNEDLDQIIKTGSKAGEGIEGASDELKELAEKALKKYELKDKEDAKKEEEEELKTIEDELKKEREEYEKSLQRLSTTDPSDEDFKSIAKLIEKIEMDRVIMKAAAAVGSAAFSVAQEFFAPMKAAGSLIKFLASLQAAVERAVALSKWVDARKGAISGVSPYATSIENFVSNQAEQFAHYTIQAAMMAIQAGAAIAETGYPPAKALTLAAGAAATLEETIYKFYKQQALVAAWKTTKASLETPDNRKLALIARRMNPTLAKYTISYGALIARDSIAIRAMNRIGLDRETLARAGDGVKLVKTFLQTTYPDDGELLGKLPPTKKGRKVPIPVLRTKPWMVTHLIWTEDMDLVGESPANITSLISRAERYTDTATDVRQEREERAYYAGRIETLQELAIAFRAYRPKDKLGLTPSEINEVIEAYVDIAEAQQAEVEQVASTRV